jgi:catechol 2,3-dioxygenase-like lactoylglutathione lyase family enzyme
MSGTGTPTSSGAVRFEGTTPILHVRSLQASLDYYVKVLGFKIDWQDPGVIASVSRDRAGIFLCKGDQGNPGGCSRVGVTDVAALYEEYLAKSATIRNPPTNYPWACEMQIADPDGNVLRLGFDSLPDRPFGEWLDMRGVRWAKAPEGRWKRVGQA